jgi:hypothetical protein
MKFFKAVAAVFLGSATLAAGQNIIETARSAGFNTLVAAIDAADLTNTFTRDGPGASDYSKFLMQCHRDRQELLSNLLFYFRPFWAPLTNYFSL